MKKPSKSLTPPLTFQPCPLPAFTKGMACYDLTPPVPGVTVTTIPARPQAA